MKQHHKIILENVHLIHAPVVQNLHFEANHFVAAGVSGMRYEGPNTIIYIDIDPKCEHFGAPARFAISGFKSPLVNFQNND